MVLEFFVPIVVGILAHFASLLSLLIGILVISALAIAGTVPDYDDYIVKIVQFNPETLRNRRLCLRLLPPQNRPRQDLTPPLTPPPIPVEVEDPPVPELPEILQEWNERRLRRQVIPKPLEEPQNNFIVPPRA